MTIRNSFLALSILFTAFGAQAIEPWDGERVIYSTKKDDNSAFYIKIDETSHSAVVVKGPNGSDGTYKDEWGSELTINLYRPIETVGYPTLTNPTNGVREQVLTRYKTTKIVLSGDEGDLKVREVGEKCSDFYVLDVVEVVCSDLDEDFDEDNQNYVLKENLGPIDLDLSNKSVVFPVEDYSSIYVSIDQNGTITLPSQGALNETANDYVRVSQLNGEIILDKKDKSKIVYGSTGIVVDDVDRVVGIKYVDGKVAEISVGSIYVDQKPNLINFRAAGSYLTTSVNGLDYRINQEPLEFEFTEDGFGGVSYVTEDGEHSYNPWIWYETSRGTVTADRYWSVDSEGYPVTIIQEFEAIQNCADSGEDAGECYLRNKRHYKVLAIDGDKVTFLRTYIWKNPAQDYREEEVYVRQSVWVMKRQ